MCLVDPGAGPVAAPLRIALVNDYEVVVSGLALMLAPFRDRVEVVELDAKTPVRQPVAVTLYDTFSQAQVDSDEIDAVLSNPAAGRVAIFTWNLHPDLVAVALRKGVRGYLSKTLTAEELVVALERIAAGAVLITPGDRSQPREATEADLTMGTVGGPSDGQDAITADAHEGGAVDEGRWPGQEQGLTVRESEVVALITQGFSNAEIATRSYLSINSVKTYIRTAYRKMGVTSRSQAVLWGVHHAMLPSPRRISPAGRADGSA